MSKTGNKELAAILTEKHGLSKQDAEKFVSQMFDVLGKALQADKQVKIKGLGTFKVISVAPRKSVDVNTGEDIVIDGRDKITFIPDAALRDDVNRPFSQFDTVVVNDGVDFSEIDKKYSETEQEDATTEEPVQRSSAETVQEPYSGQEQGTHVDEIIENAVDESPEIDIKDNNIEQKEEKVEQQEKAIEQKGETEERKKEETTKPKDATTDAELVGIVHHQHRTIRYVCLGAAAIVLAFIVCGFYFFNQLKLRDNLIEHLEAQVMEKENNKAEDDTVPAASTTTVISSTKDTEVTTVKPMEKASEKEKEDVGEKENANTKTEKKGNANPGKDDNKATKDLNSDDYNKDVRIRTGAYAITGIDHTITARKGQTLAGISRSQLGPGMECYVEAVNGWKKEFKEGEKVNIPKLKLKKLLKRSSN